LKISNEMEFDEVGLRFHSSKIYAHSTDFDTLIKRYFILEKIDRKFVKHLKKW
jgi:hypothetical protein